MKKVECTVSLRQQGGTGDWQVNLHSVFPFFPLSLLLLGNSMRISVPFFSSRSRLYSSCPLVILILAGPFFSHDWGLITCQTDDFEKQIVSATVFVIDQ